MTEQAPAWLVAWCEGRTAPAAPAQPSAQPQAAPRQGGKGGKPKARAANGLSKGANGFSEPKHEAWSFDGGKRREAVLDLDDIPPRVVRQVGWRICMSCAKPFWSSDVIGVRLCIDCKLPPRGQRRNP